MRKLNSFLFFLFGVLMMQTSAWATTAASDAQLQAIAEMGRLNGIALQCRYLPQVQRIKRELVLNLPKQRALGDWFEQKTNEAFLGFIKQDKSCPAQAEFNQTVQQAIIKLEAAFKP